ncbi:MAG: SH3 domain-containing protein [Bacteroidota bacterium]|jgi:tetratricopeptide (TPR) repeat protein
MQAYYLKKIIFFFIFNLSFIQLAKSQSDAKSLKKADSLYKVENFDAAEAIFEKNRPKLKNPSAHYFLKLAAIKEKKGDFLNTLYFLNKAFEQEPNQKIIVKLNEIANLHELQGYELNDFNFLILFYKQYSGFLVALLLILGIYIFVILFIKKYKSAYIPINQKIFLVVYLLGIGLLLNLPDKYHQGIINHDGVYLRSEPSSAAQVESVIDRGNRLNVIGGNDIWRRVIWNERFLYLKESDVWLVE